MKRSSKSENVLILDISSGSVGVALVRHTKNSLPEVIHSIRSPFAQSESFHLERLEKKMLNSLDKALVHIATKGLPILHTRSSPTHIHRLMVTFNSPWMTSRLIKAKKDIGIKELDEGFKHELMHKYSSESEVFESVTLGQSFNESHHSQSAAEKRLVRNIEDRVLKHFNIKSGVSFHTFMFAYLKVLTGSFQNLSTFMLVRMSEEVTDFMYFENSLPIFSVSQPIGIQTIAKEVAKEMKTEINLAFSYLSLFSLGVLDDRTTKQMDEILSKYDEKWKKTWNAIAEDLPAIKGGEQVFLLANNPYERIFKTLLESILPKNPSVILGIDNDFASKTTRYPSSEVSQELLIATAFSELLR